jgi:hypothetical protein
MLDRLRHGLAPTVHGRSPLPKRGQWQPCTARTSNRNLSLFPLQTENPYPFVQVRPLDAQDPRCARDIPFRARERVEDAFPLRGVAHVLQR